MNNNFEGSVFYVLWRANLPKPIYWTGGGSNFETDKDVLVSELFQSPGFNKNESDACRGLEHRQLCQSFKALLRCARATPTRCQASTAETTSTNWTVPRRTSPFVVTFFLLYWLATSQNLMGWLNIFKLLSTFF